jgi:peptidoglycan/LPS O-acetylase OafA/YrhL
MKKPAAPAQTSVLKDRLLVFDVARICLIALIVYNHFQVPVWDWLNNTFFSNGYFLFNIYPRSLGVIAIYGMFLISGAVLEYQYKKVRTIPDYKKFLFRRFVRLYPAFWMSLLLGILLAPAVLGQNLPGVLFEFTGFFMFLGTGPGIINQMGWFIGTIFVLYMLYPVLSSVIRKYGFPALLAVMLVSYGTRSLLLTYNPVPMVDLWLWLPVCNLFEFCLGIYLIQQNLYPKTANQSSVVRQLADLSFYVFLFHVVIIHAVLAILPSTPIPNAGYFLYGGILALIVIISWIAMVIDNRIQVKIMAYARAGNLV